MALTVATNTGALMAQAAASSVNKEMEISMERLSTGKRINSAADDAAGIAIASRLTSEIRGTNQAIRNAMDAQGLIDTAEGAHDEIANILQRMREVAVQAINDTNSSKDRAALQTEMNQLKTEVDRIAHSTTWAGIQLLNGDATTAVATSTAGNKSVTFQVGSGTATSDSVNLTIDAMSAAKLSLGSTSAVSASFKSESTAASGTAAVSVGTVTTAGGFSVTASGGEITLTKATTAPTTSGDSGNEKVTITIEGTAVAFDVYDDAIAKGYSNTVASLTEALTQKIEDAKIDGTSVAVDASPATKTVITTSGTANSVTWDSTNEEFDIANFDAGETIVVTVEGTDITVVNSTSDGYAETTGGFAQHLAQKINDAKIDGITAAVDGGGSVEITKAAGLDISSSTFEAAAIATKNNVLSTIDTALETLNTQRGKLGAYSNRLDNTVSNLTSMSNNLQAGRGRIEDADFAAETTSLAKSQILQQASTAMLAQANASKQNVLSLLQG